MSFGTFTKAHGKIRLAAVVAALISGMPTGSQASLAISKGATANVTCTAGVCKASADPAVLNATDLANMLATGDVSVVPGFIAKDIEVSASFSWVSAHRLTLDAYRAITVGKTVSVAGTGALTLTIDDGGSGGALTFVDQGRVEFWDLASDLEIQGNTYVLVKNVKTLAKLIRKNHTGYFALAKNYDASKDGTYVKSPIAKFYGGGVEGLGNAISNLSITSTAADLGLFANVGSAATIRNLRLVDVDLQSPYDFGMYVGPLVGFNAGTVDDCYASGYFSSPNGIYFGGGLVGHNSGLVERSASDVEIVGAGWLSDLVGENTGTILQSFATGTVTNLYLGGVLVAINKNGTIEQSYATGDISNGSTIGGLVGLNNMGTVSDSYATGNVSGTDNPGGGLVGQNDGTITHSYATATVYKLGEDPFSPAMGGGLVGWNRLGEIDQSFATGPVSSNFYAGGLVGANGGDQNNKDTASIHQSFATGPVTALEFYTFIGGLAGSNVGVTIADSYATGSVTGLDNADAGGFVGWNSNSPAKNHDAAIRNCYASGQTSAGSQASVGGVIGLDSAPGTTTDCYWDLETTGISNTAEGAGNIANDPGLTGLTTLQFQSGLPPGFDPAIWAQDPGVNNGYPYLIAVPPPGHAPRGIGMRFSNSFRTSSELHRKFLDAAAQLRKANPQHATRRNP
jgi:hypothetical protein